MTDNFTKKNCATINYDKQSHKKCAFGLEDAYWAGYLRFYKDKVD